MQGQVKKICNISWMPVSSLQSGTNLSPSFMVPLKISLLCKELVALESIHDVDSML